MHIVKIGNGGGKTRTRRGRIVRLRINPQGLSSELGTIASYEKGVDIIVGGTPDPAIDETQLSIIQGKSNTTGFQSLKLSQAFGGHSSNLHIREI